MHARVLHSTLALGTATATLACIASPVSASTYRPDPEDRYILAARGSAEGFLSSLRGGDVALRAPLVPRRTADRRIAMLVKRRMYSAATGRNISVTVSDTQSGKEIFSYRPTAGLLPASNMKVVTAANALHALGPTKRFETKVVKLGTGAIALVGGGDATLGDSGISDLARQTAAAVRSDSELTPVPGRRLRVFIDDSLYPAPTAPAGWRDGYEPGVVRPVRALGIDGDYTMDAARSAGQQFAAALRAKGVPAGYVARTSSAGKPTVASHLGLRLSAQVKYMLQVSENNVAEMLFRNTALATGQAASWVGASRAAAIQLRDMGVQTAGTSLKSGSGVARNDRLTTRMLTSVLNRIADRTDFPELASIYYGAGLPLAGRSGTLAASNGRFNTRPTNCAAGRVRAKTGTLFDTTALSGLTVGADGRLKSFSVFVNSRPQSVPQLSTRRSIDRIAATVNGCY